MFFKKGSLSQLVLAMIFSLAFGFTVAWLRPFASRTANLFKVCMPSFLFESLSRLSSIISYGKCT